MNWMPIVGASSGLAPLRASGQALVVRVALIQVKTLGCQPAALFLIGDRSYAPGMLKFGVRETELAEENFRVVE